MHTYRPCLQGWVCCFAAELALNAPGLPALCSDVLTESPSSDSLRDLWVCSDDGGRLSELAGDWWETACLTGSLPFTPLDFLDAWHHPTIFSAYLLFFFYFLPRVDSILIFQPLWSPDFVDEGLGTFFKFTTLLMVSVTCFHVCVASPLNLETLLDLSDLCRQIWLWHFSIVQQMFNFINW